MRISDWSSDVCSSDITQDRMEGRPYGQRLIAPIPKISQGQAKHRVNSPGVDAPMEEGNAHGVARRLRRPGHGIGRLSKVHNGFGHAITHNAYTHSCPEQHGNPSRAKEPQIGKE